MKKDLTSAQKILLGLSFLCGIVLLTSSLPGTVSEDPDIADAKALLEHDRQVLSSLDSFEGRVENFQKEKKILLQIVDKDVIEAEELLQKEKELTKTLDDLGNAFDQVIDAAEYHLTGSLEVSGTSETSR